MRTPASLVRINQSLQPCALREGLAPVQHLLHTLGESFSLHGSITRRTVSSLVAADRLLHLPDVAFAAIDHLLKHFDDALIMGEADDPSQLLHSRPHVGDNFLIHGA